MENRPGDTEYRLLVLGDGSVRTVPLHGARWIVGRAPDCDVPLRDPTVSRRHLRIERDGVGFRFQDLGGSNAVLLDGKPSAGGRLLPGQTLAIGLTRLILEVRTRPLPLATSQQPTVVLTREVADEEDVDEAPGSLASTAARVLDRIEWTFADLGDLNHAAEPLLDLALNLTGHRRGWIGRFNSSGAIEMLATLDVSPARKRSRKPEPLRIPESVLHEARRIARPHLLATDEGRTTTQRLVVPLGSGPDGLLVLEDATAAAPAGQTLLRLAQSLRAVVWHRLQETAERQRLRDELERLRFHGSATHNALLASTRLQEVRQALRELAGTGDAVLLVGEEGTELEDLGRYLHAESPRRQQAFIPWNAVRTATGHHEHLLFGDGARTTGLVQRAKGGTLFIDRFDWLTPALRDRLARLPDGGQSAAPILVATTTDAGRAGAGMTVPLPWLPHQQLAVPPLRGHARDILTLAELFLSDLGNRPDGAPRLLTERTKRLLVTHSWPGNVRELRLVLEGAAACAMNQPIAPRHLPVALGAAAGDADAPPIPTLAEVERSHIADVMVRTGGNRTRAAQILGIAPSTLYEKLKGDKPAS